MNIVKKTPIALTPLSLRRSPLWCRVYARIFSILLAVGTTATQAAIPPSERQALLDLYTSTNGDGWKTNTNWNGPPGTECTWYGVSCDAGQNTVTQIVLSDDLNGNNLTGTLPASLKQLTNLEDFVVPANHLTGPIPDFSGAVGITGFDVSLNQLTGPIFDLSKLTNLFEFRADHNQLTGPIPALAGLTNMWLFKVDNNRLTGPIPPLTGLVGLIGFVVSNNQLTGSIPTLTGLTRLQDFIVSNNQLTGSIPALTGLTQLQNFLVNDNQLTGSIPGLSGLTQLFVFNVANNHLTGDAPAVAPELFAGSSSLCPNLLNPRPDAGWDIATGQTPWYANCVDTTPDTFHFAAVTGATGGQVYISLPITVSGINAASPINVACRGAPCAYRINGGAWLTGTSTVNNGATVEVQTTASTTAGATVSGVATIGGVVGSYDVITAAVPVPTLSRWAMVLLSGLLAILAAFGVFGPRILKKRSR